MTELGEPYLPNCQSLHARLSRGNSLRWVRNVRDLKTAIDRKQPNIRFV